MKSIHHGRSFVVRLHSLSFQDLPGIMSEGNFPTFAEPISILRSNHALNEFWAIPGMSAAIKAR